MMAGLVSCRRLSLLLTRRYFFRECRKLIGQFNVPRIKDEDCKGERTERDNKSQEGHPLEPFG